MGDHIYKTVEITGSSSDGITEAINAAVAKASKSLRNIDWFEVIGVRGHVGGGGVAHFQVSLKIGFRLED